MAGTAQYKNNWQKEHTDRINLTVPKGQKAIIQAHAQARGESISSFINRAIREAIERDLSLDKVAVEDQGKPALSKLTQSGRQRQIIIAERDSMHTNK